MRITYVLVDASDGGADLIPPASRSAAVSAVAISRRSGAATASVTAGPYRFETPEGVKLLSVTPQPTDHSPGRPA
jgi:hypothetical protein